MDTAAIRQAHTAMPVEAGRMSGYVVSGAVPTELPASQSVASAWEAAAVRSDISPHAATLARLAERTALPAEQRFERDRRTEVLVFKKIDPSTGEVMLQLPDQSLLDLRAYLKKHEDAALPALERNA
jgi:hypothetical protein